MRSKHLGGRQGLPESSRATLPGLQLPFPLFSPLQLLHSTLLPHPHLLHTLMEYVLGGGVRWDSRGAPGGQVEEPQRLEPPPPRPTSDAHPDLRWGTSRESEIRAIGMGVSICMAPHSPHPLSLDNCESC